MTGGGGEMAAAPGTIAYYSLGKVDGLFDIVAIGWIEYSTYKIYKKMYKMRHKFKLYENENQAYIIIVHN
jgi:hypothetical protein